MRRPQGRRNSRFAIIEGGREGKAAGIDKVGAPPLPFQAGGLTAISRRTWSGSGRVQGDLAREAGSAEPPVFRRFALCRPVSTAPGPGSVRLPGPAGRTIAG